MKSLSVCFLFASCVFAQGPAPKAPVPPPAAAAAAEAPPVDFKPDTVVAKIGAKPVTVSEIRSVLATLPSELQKAFMDNPKGAMQSLALMDYLSKEADKNKLADQSPYKEQLAMQRMQILAQAESSRHAEQVDVKDEDVRKAYEKGKSGFEQAKISVLFVAFADPKEPAAAPAEGEKPKKTLTEAEAKAKADGLVKQARGGANFAELAKKNSDEPTSAAKGGEFGKVSRGDQIPEEIKTAIFATKKGGVSDPVKQGPGFYIMKVDDITTPTLDDVREQLTASLKSEQHQQWIQGLQKQFEVTIETPTFFGAQAAPAAPAAPVK